MKFLFIHGIGSWRQDLGERWVAALNRSTALDVWPKEAEMLYWDTRDIAGATSERPKVVRGLKSPNLGLCGFKKWLLSRGEPLFKAIVDTFVDEVAWYFYQGGRSVVLETVKPALASKEPYCLITHSMGTVIALDALTQLQLAAGNCNILITMGSPLGNDWIKEAIGAPDYPANVRRWLNVYEGLDPVTLPDQEISNDYRTYAGSALIIDRMVRENRDNHGYRNPHSWYGYLTSHEVGDAVTQYMLTHA